MISKCHPFTIDPAVGVKPVQKKQVKNGASQQKPSFMTGWGCSPAFGRQNKLYGSTVLYVGSAYCWFLSHPLATLHISIQE